MQDIGLLLFRVYLGGIMLFVHGLPKLLNFSEYVEKFPDYIGLGANVSLSLAIFGEVICAAVLILGFKTRYILVPLIITMAVAFFIHHGADPFKQKELSFMYLCGYIALLFTGAGKYSIDRK